MTHSNLPLSTVSKNSKTVLLSSILTSCLLFIGFSLPLTSQAAGRSHANLDQGLPGAGMSMAQVRARFGAPLAVRGPVGKPPITRWNYAGFTVYFEHSHVVHSVRFVHGLPAKTTLILEDHQHTDTIVSEGSTTELNAPSPVVIVQPTDRETPAVVISAP